MFVSSWRKRSSVTSIPIFQKIVSKMITMEFFFHKHFSISFPYIYSFFHHKLDEYILDSIKSILPFKRFELEFGFKYLGYFLKSNDYRVWDWFWLLENFEFFFKNWTFKLLSIGGRLTLIRDILTSIHVYWFSLMQVPSCNTSILTPLH